MEGSRDQKNPREHRQVYSIDLGEELNQAIWEGVWADKNDWSLKEIEAVDVDGDTYPDEPYFYYPEGRDIVGYDDYGVPEYSFENVMQMDEETGRQYYDRIFDESIHIDLDEFDLMGEWE